MSSASSSQPSASSSESIKVLHRLKSLETIPNLTADEANLLAQILITGNEEELIATVSVISCACSFSSNIDIIIDSGCPSLLVRLLDNSSECVVIAATQAIANLTFYPRGEKIFGSHVISLFVNKLLSQSSTSSSPSASISYVQIDYILMALGNFAIKDEYHNQMIPIIGLLREWQTSSSPTIRTRSSKLMSNLSKNPAMVSHLFF